MSTDSLIGFAAVNGLQCPGQDWFYRKGTATCYYISNPNAGDASSPPVVITNWNEVVQECINRGGALLTIEDEKELVGFASTAIDRALTGYQIHKLG